MSSGDCRSIIPDCDALRKLAEELEGRFNLAHVANVSYALAVCLHTATDEPALDGVTGFQPRCLLIDRNALDREYPKSSDYNFYPQAFHPTYGNVSSRKPPSTNDLLATKGFATAALTIPTNVASSRSLMRSRRERRLGIIRGDPDARPFARERRQIETALEYDEYPYRLEQVISLDVGRITSTEYTFATVTTPILYLTTLFSDVEG
ncbi:hypothetical protein B0T11DRAFT_356187 [Plectosphaerella cucumerina]|uniref:Uncharacterized protein n=1 Tax=Plectosphaerella cucumerina TaxID=40658 RepID=A0A8K0TD75_9PEZI|nr:hypothetical protein B0T11DRAFT_356187 [Plectosphaerella cucumerina]